MANYKQHPKYNVVSIRVSDEEKALLDELKLSTSKSISMLLREAMRQYNPQLKVAFK